MASLIELGIIFAIFGVIYWAIARKSPERNKADKRNPD